MLILSQDKETIINFENITRASIVPPVEKGYKYSIAINGCLDLGYYTSKERAKEVLQEIILHYKATETFKAVSNKISDQVSCIAIKQGFVYEIPEK